MKRILEPEKLQGKYVNLREVTVDDAEFILSLRCDPKKSKYLNPTEYNIPKQQEYIRNYGTPKMKLAEEISSKMTDNIKKLSNDMCNDILKGMAKQIEENEK